MSTVTTGLNTAARIKITSSAPTLVLSPTNTGQLLTYQITAQVTDVAGNVLDPQPDLYYDILGGFDSATVSDEGLVTAEAPGNVIVQVSAAALGATSNLFTPAGIPINAITAEQSVLVTEGAVPLDFYFTLAYSEGTYTITQSPETDSTWSEEVTYTLGPSNANPTVLGTITGSGTRTFTNGSNNFVLQATDFVTGRFHAIFTMLNSGPLIGGTPMFPQTSSRGGGNGTASGTADSGTPYVA